MGGDRQGRLEQYVTLMRSLISNYVEWVRMYAIDVESQAILHRVAEPDLISNKGPSYLKLLCNKACRWAEGH